ncbi:MAG: LysR substrate-binding domain-containing protein [Lysobacterales bacterium]
MNIRDLNYLVALADLRHFGHAAEACFVSQPTLSTQIKKLEEELGVQLIERAPRQVMLTEVGAEVVERARLVLRDVEQIREVARRATEPQSGVLRLGIFPTLGPYLLPHVIPQIHQKYPGLELLLVEEKSEVLMSQLRDGRLDAAILAQPVEADQLQCRQLFEEPFVLALPQGHPLDSKGALTIDSLKDHTVLLLEDGHCLRDQALEVCKLAAANEKPGFRATSLETLRQMVAANVGLTLLPMLAVKPPVAITDSIHIRPFDDPPPSRKLAMFWRSSSAMDGFLMEFAEIFASLPDDLLTPKVS